MAPAPRKERSGIRSLLTSVLSHPKRTERIVTALAGAGRQALMRGLGLAFALTPIVATSASANPVKSLYTTVDLKACKKLERPGGAAWHCPGLSGVPVYVAKGGLKQFVSAGTDAARRRAATQTLAGANSIFEQGRVRALVEWRFDRRGDKQLPYAIIVRFHTGADLRRGDVLVVLKVAPRETCHLAYVDALANENAIALARSIADTKARTFDCNLESIAAGAWGRGPM